METVKTCGMDFMGNVNLNDIYYDFDDEKFVMTNIHNGKRKVPDEDEDDFDDDQEDLAILLLQLASRDKEMK